MAYVKPYRAPLTTSELFVSMTMSPSIVNSMEKSFRTTLQQLTKGTITAYPSLQNPVAYTQTYSFLVNNYQSTLNYGL